MATHESSSWSGVDDELVSFRCERNKRRQSEARRARCCSSIASTTRVNSANTRCFGKHAAAVRSVVAVKAKWGSRERERERERERRTAPRGRRLRFERGRQSGSDPVGPKRRCRAKEIQQPRHGTLASCRTAVHAQAMKERLDLGGAQANRRLGMQGRNVRDRLADGVLPPLCCACLARDGEAVSLVGGAVGVVVEPHRLVNQLLYQGRVLRCDQVLIRLGE